jgi:hypothetical protein
MCDDCAELSEMLALADIALAEGAIEESAGFTQYAGDLLDEQETRRAVNGLGSAGHA